MSNVEPDTRTVTAFAGSRRIASGALDDVARKAFASPDGSTVLIFDDRTGRVVDVDMRDVEGRVSERAASPVRKPGRPKLGVVAREVTLLPRHWEWLSRQAGGASVALRKLVDEARRARAGTEQRREARDAAYAFIMAMAGDAAGFEEASRALFAGQAERFHELVAAWPADIANHAVKLAAPAFEPDVADA